MIRSRSPDSAAGTTMLEILVAPTVLRGPGYLQLGSNSMFIATRLTLLRGSVTRLEIQV